MDTLGTQMLGVLWKASLQAAVLAAVVWAVCRLAKKAPAGFRCALWVLVLVKLFVPPFADLPASVAFWAHRSPVAPIAVERVRPSVPQSVSVPTPAPQTMEQTPVAPMSIPSPAEMLVLIWGAAVCVLGARLVVRARQQKRLLIGCAEASHGLLDLLEDAACSLDMRRMPRLKVSEAFSTPTLVGVINPTIVLPQKVAESCSAEETRAMLLHELAHIKRRDMVLLWLHEVAQALFFFHPAVWIAGREIQVERELACDELVVGAASISAVDYAAGYVTALRLARQSAAVRMTLGMAEPFEVGKRRLEMILRNEIPRLSVKWMISVAAVAVIGLPTFAGIAEKPVRSRAVPTHPAASRPSASTVDTGREIKTGIKSRAATDGQPEPATRSTSVTRAHGTIIETVDEGVTEVSVSTNNPPKNFKDETNAPADLSESNPQPSQATTFVDVEPDPGRQVSGPGSFEQGATAQPGEGNVSQARNERHNGDVNIPQGVNNRSTRILEASQPDSPTP